jgi:hypothetical protein
MDSTMSGQPQGVNSAMAARNCRTLIHQVEVEQDHQAQLSAAPCWPPPSQQAEAMTANALN